MRGRRAPRSPPVAVAGVHRRPSREDPASTDVANTFQRGWLTLVYLTAFALAGLDGARRRAGPRRARRRPVDVDQLRRSCGCCTATTPSTGARPASADRLR